MFRQSIAASACAWMLMAAAPAVQARPTVTIVPDSRSVVLESHGDSLKAAMEALAAEAGFSFRAGGSVDLGVPVEGTFQGSLDDVLGRLLTGYDYLVVRGAGSAEAPGPVQRVVVTYAKAVPGKVTPPPPAPGTKDAAEKSDVAKLLEQQAVSQAKAAKAPVSSAATNASANQQNGGAVATTTAGSGGSARGGAGQGATASGGLPQGGSQAAAAIAASPQLQEQIRATTAKAQQDLQALVEALRSSACPAGGCQPQ